MADKIRRWGFDGSSSGAATIAEIRRAPYHNRLAKLSPQTRELTEFDLHDLHSFPWESKVHVYDWTEDGLAQVDHAVSKFRVGSGEYGAKALEQLRERMLKDLASQGGRVLLIEDLTPPVLEVVGWTWQLEPAVFLRHIDQAWGRQKASISSAHSRPSAWPCDPSECIDFCIRYPRLVAVCHPSVPQRDHSEWRQDCFRRASRYLQGRRLLPLIDLPQEFKTDCVAYDHVTVSIDDVAGNDWQALVLFPPSVKEWQDGRLKVEKEQLRSFEVHTQPKDKFDGSTGDEDVLRWLSRLDSACSADHQKCGAFSTLHSLFVEALGHWKLHVHQVTLAIDMLSNNAAQPDEVDLEAQRQIRVIILKGLTMLSEMEDDIRAAAEKCDPTHNKIMRKLEIPGYGDAPLMAMRLLARCDEVHQIKMRLERHLPTLQNQIDFAISKQQVELQQTQLEESRKAIQQADTIKRLTILAFIYIPVQTASSIYGMNLQELTPNPSIWVFVVTALALLVLTLTAAAWQHITPYLYRLSNSLFGSVRMQACCMLRRLGIRVATPSENGDDKLPAWQNNPQPSWFQ